MITAEIRLFALSALLALWVGVSFSAEPSDRKIDDEITKQDEIYKSQGEKQPEGYVINRTLKAYVEALAPGLQRAIANMAAKDRWLDIGAGEGQAILDYYNSTDNPENGDLPRLSGAKAQAVAVSIEDRRQALWHQTATRLAPKQMQYFFSKRMRDYSLNELGKFQVVTDLLGGFSYTDELSLFMDKVLELLEVKGSFYTILQDVKSEQGTNKPYYENSPYLTEISNNDGSEVKVCSWLKSIACVQVSCELRSDWKPPVEIYRIDKVCNEVKVPALSKTRYEAGTPPERRFQLLKK